MLSAAEVIDFCVRLCLWRHSDGLNAGLNIVYILIGDKQCPVSKFLECCILDTPFRPNRLSLTVALFLIGEEHTINAWSKVFQTINEDGEQLIILVSENEAIEWRETAVAPIASIQQTDIGHILRIRLVLQGQVYSTIKV